jgi:death-on-curing protein
VTIYINAAQAIAVVEHLGLRVRDRGLLFSALARPATSLFGEDAYPTLELKAAALLSSQAQDHALFDGNKRLSLLLAFSFLRLNGRQVTFSNDEAFDLIVSAAQGHTSLEDLTDQIAKHTTALSPGTAEAGF